MEKFIDVSASDTEIGRAVRSKVEYFYKGSPELSRLVPIYIEEYFDLYEWLLLGNTGYIEAKEEAIEKIGESIEHDFDEMLMRQALLVVNAMGIDLDSGLFSSVFEKMKQAFIEVLHPDDLLSVDKEDYEPNYADAQSSALSVFSKIISNCK